MILPGLALAQSTQTSDATSENTNGAMTQTQDLDDNESNTVSSNTALSGQNGMETAGAVPAAEGASVSRSGSEKQEEHGEREERGETFGETSTQSPQVNTVQSGASTSTGNLGGANSPGAGGSNSMSGRSR